MKQLTDQALAQVRDALANPRSNPELRHAFARAALTAARQAQPVPVNAMLVEALQAAENLEHEALVALSEATYELKVGNTYTTATDTYKANNDLIHRLDKILNSQYRDRKRAALTAAKQAQPVCKCTFAQKTVGDGCAVCNPKLAAELSQPERTPLSEAWLAAMWSGIATAANRNTQVSDYVTFARAVEAAHGIKQGGQHE